MTEPTAPASRRDRAGWRSPVLVVLTVVAMVASTVAVWARATVLDTDRFMEVVGPVLSDPAFAAALGDVVAEQVLVALDLESRVAVSLEELDTFLADAVLDATDAGAVARDRLSGLDRPTLSALAPGIAAALETRVTEVVDGFVTSEALPARLPGLVREAHTGGVALVRGELAQLPNVQVSDGEVRLDLVPVIAQALQEVLVELRDFLPGITIPQVLEGRADAGRELLAEALQTRLPADFGQLTLMTSADLSELQGAVRSVDRLVVALVVLTVVLLAVTIATSRRRRRIVVQLAAGLTLGIGVAALLVRSLESAVLGAITHPNGNRAAGVLLDELTHSLRSAALLVAVAALATGVAAHVLGQPSWLADVPRGSRGRVVDRVEDGVTEDREPRRPPVAVGTQSEGDGR
jgi:hypothetical protein